MQEFWFSALWTFLYFTAFMAQIIEFSGITDIKYQYWYDAQVTAGVRTTFLKWNMDFFSPNVLPDELLGLISTKKYSLIQYL